MRRSSDCARTRNMKLYGSKRKSRQTCKYGCCGWKESAAYKHKRGARLVRKAAKHRARQEARQEATVED